MTMTRCKVGMVALAICATAAFALGQSSSTSTSSGTYKITLVAPNEGESIAADQVRVVLTPNMNAMGDAKTQIDVFLDDQQKGVLKPEETEFRVDGVRPGPHKLVLIARNPVSDAVFDRREINFVATGEGSTVKGVSSVTENAVGAHVPPAVSSTDKQHQYMALGETHTDVNTATTTAKSTTTEQPAPAPRPSTYAPPTSTSTSTNESGGTDDGRSGERLPKTASSDALLALAGAALLVTGAALRRAA